jgi:hypothetical protein
VKDRFYKIGKPELRERWDVPSDFVADYIIFKEITGTDFGEIDLLFLTLPLRKYGEGTPFCYKVHDCWLLV